MEELDYYWSRYNIFLEYMYNDSSFPESIEIKNNQLKWVKQAYDRKDLKFMKMLDRYTNIEINSWPDSAKREIQERFYEELGEVPSDLEVKLNSKIKSIIKKGKITSRTEYDLIQSALDNIYANSTDEKLSDEEYSVVDKYEGLLKNAEFKEHL